MKGKRLSIILVFMAAISLCLSAAIFAWVTINNRIRSANTKITVIPVSDVRTIDCYALRFDGSVGAICYAIGEGEGKVLSVEMTEFDRIFRDRSINTPLVYVVELANVPNVANYYISVRVPCNEKYILLQDNTVTNQLTAAEDDRSYSIQNYISNIISVKVGCSGAIPPLTPTTTQRVENNVNLFNTEKTAFKDITESNYPNRVGQFAHVTDGEGTITYSKDDYVQVRLTQSEYGGYLYTIPNEAEPSGNHLILYIQFDYHEYLMDNYISLLGDARDDDIAFVDDLGIIQILVGTGGN